MCSHASPDLPRWDLTTIYPDVDSEAYAASVNRLTSLIDALESLLDAADALTATDGDDVTETFDRIIAAFNDSLGLARQNRWYLEALIAVNTRDQAALARMSELQAIRTRRAVAESRFIAWLGRVDIEALVKVSPAAHAHAFLLRQSAIAANHLMDQPREALAAQMQASGGNAWSRLQDTVASQIMVTIEMPDGDVMQMPIAETLAYSVHPDRDLRRRAHQGRKEAWHLWREPIAAALNGVKGEHITLAQARGWTSILEESLFQNRLDHRTLETMMDACRRRLPDFQRYLRAKARALDIETLAWYDLWVPVPGSSSTWPWETCTAFVIDQFDAYSDELGALARRAFDERWIDAGPRADKTGGGWCLPMGDGTSRVLLNHIDTFDDVMVLAHELGHAYHNRCDARVSPWRRESRPTILAETASTFCETLVTRAAVAQASDTERPALLDAWLGAANMSVTEMVIALDFETAVIDRRAARELSADEFSSLLHDHRLAAYGDSLQADELGEHGWEGPPHYYMPWKSYYSYPYTFGLLFGLGLYAMYQREPDKFRSQFDNLLASTGDADAATLTRDFGIDIQTSSFWEGSLDVICADIDAFVGLVDRRFSANR